MTDLVATSDQDVQSSRSSTIGAVIRAHAERRPEDWAVIGTDFAPVSYRELQQQIDDVRVCLRQAGFDRNARIAVDITDSAPAAWTIVAVACSAAAVPLDPKLTGPEVERCLRILNPNAVLVLNGNNSAARGVAERHGVPIIEAAVARQGRLGLELLAPRVGPACPLDDPDPDAPAFILHTSGTTAEPNLVPFSHRNVLASNERVSTWFSLTPQDRCLNVSPVYYSHALTTTVLPPLLTGGSTAFPANTLNVDLFEWFGALRPTWYSAGPAVQISILNKAQRHAGSRTMHSLRLISSAGAALPNDVHEEIEQVLGVPVLQHYGSSETAQIASNRPPPGPSKLGTCGMPWPDIIMIVGEDGRQVSPGERGEILVSGPSVTSGYLNAPELNRMVFVDGWYRTGDIGSLDEQGFLSLHARKRELINRGAEKIAPLEIDHALMRHPAVSEAAAYGVPHATLGEDVAAAVVLRSGAKVTAEELREFLRAQLAAFKIPRSIAVVDRLPRGITGKVQRTRLNEIVSTEPVSPDVGAGSAFGRLWKKLGTLFGLEPARSSRPPSSHDTLETPPGGITAEGAALSDERLRAELLHIWRRILKVESLGIDDNFFENGGNSLLAMDVHVELQRLTTKSIPATLLSEAPTIRALAKALSS